MTLDEILADLVPLKRWVPYRLIWSPKREKFDKIPHNGRRGLSTKSPDDWSDFVGASTTAKELDLAGVGIVLTGGIEQMSWRLVGFDYDQVDFEHFEPLFPGYSEISPSETGVRTFAWVPTPWAIRFKDTTTKLNHCDHCEIYLGSAARFLTITGNTISDEPIPYLTDKQLAKLEPKMNPADPAIRFVEMPEVEGTPINLSNVHLTPDQDALLSGSTKIDRSAVLHGFLIQLIDAGKRQEDIIATILKNEALWQYCLSHRNNNPEKAILFAHQEATRAYNKSLTAKKDALVGFNAAWKKPEMEPEKKPLPECEHLEFPEILFDNAPGLVGDIARWVMKASYAPRKEFAYAVALSMTATLIGPYCTQGSRGGKLNLYLTLVGGTGTGKNEAIDTMGMLLAATDAKDIVQDFPASESALRRQLVVGPNILIRIDELAHKLEMMTKNDSNGLARVILEAYNGAYMPAKKYADTKNSLEAVENPFVQILGGTTDKVWDVLKTSHLEDGTLNRFIFVCLPDKAPYSRNAKPDATVPKELKDKLNAFFRIGKRFDLLGYIPPGFGRLVSFTPEVEQAIEELDLNTWEPQQGEFGSLWTRYVMHVTKIACILAVGDGRLLVEMKDFRQAKQFMSWSIMNTSYKVGVRMVSSSFEGLEKKFLKKLRENNGKMTMRDAYRTMHLKPREMLDLTTALVEAGEVEIVEGEAPATGGHTPQWIKLV